MKLFDRISSQVAMPTRGPSGEAIGRCRDAVESIQAATSHKYSRDRAELVHLLGTPHIQVSDGCSKALKSSLCHVPEQRERKSELRSYVRFIILNF